MDYTLRELTARMWLVA